MHRLTIVNSTINRIEANAFNEHAFRQLESLFFSDMPSLTLVPGWSRGLRSLTIINAFGEPIENPADIPLEPIGGTLTRISLQTLSNDVDFRDVFGRNPLPALEEVCVEYNYKTTVDRILDSNSFSALIAIRSLGLTQCRIVAVRSGTFDKIARKLHVIELSRNQLKDLSGDVFAAVFNAETEAYNNKQLWFWQNPMRCSCEYYQLRNMSSLSPTVEVYFDECDDDSEAPYDPTKCGRTQMIRSRRNCFRPERFDLFGHPAIEFRVVENRTGKFIRVESETSGAFKMFVVDTDRLVEERENCFRSEIRCFLLPNGTSIIPMARLDSNASIVSFFATFNMNPALVWPLNYHSILSRARGSKMEETELRWYRSPIVVALGFVIWLVGACLVCVVTIRSSEPLNDAYV